MLLVVSNKIGYYFSNCHDFMYIIEYIPNPAYKTCLNYSSNIAHELSDLLNGGLEGISKAADAADEVKQEDDVGERRRILKKKCFEGQSNVTSNIK